MRMPSGVRGFDELVQGGFPEGSCVVLQGPSGVEKDYFAYSFLVEGLRRGEAVLVVLSSKPPSSLIDELKARGFDPQQLFEEGRFRIVDWYTQREQSVVEIEEAGLVIKTSLDLLNVGIAITRAISSLDKDRPKRAVVDVLSPAVSAHDLAQVHTFAQATKAKLSRHHITSLFLIEREMHDSTALSTLVQPFDGVIDIDRTREGDRIVRKLAVLSLKETAAQNKYVSFELTEDGSIALEPGMAGAETTGGQAPGQEKRRDADLWFSLGKALMQSGRLEKALVALDSCLRVDTQNAEAWRLKGEILEKLGRKEEAEKAHLSASAGAAGEGAESAADRKPEPPPRLFRILEISDSRLVKDKNDTDALFAKAAVLATLKRYDESLNVLNELTKVNHRYPGLWLLKAKIYAVTGDSQKAKLCTERSRELDHEEEPARSARPLTVQFSCPLCNTLVDEHATKCPSCGTPFAEAPSPPVSAPKPPEHPERLERPEVKQPPSESKTTVPPSELRVPPKEGAVKGARGRTNGLRGRTNGLTNGLRGRTNGLTNGLRGRTNGLTNGLRGRTNGLTNGLRGRTNGLTNGLRGRTNGLTNGLRGRTNGLVNGLARAAGKVNGLATESRAGGVTNGLVNGLRSLRAGITNGLTNGNGFTNGLGSSRFRRQARANRWKLYMVPLTTVLLLLVPLTFPSSLHNGRPYIIEIDGGFGDWTGQRVVSMQTDPGVSPNVRMSKVGVADNIDYLAFYVEVEGAILAGGPDPQRLMDSVRVFIDADRSATTGYLVRGLGAEWMVEIWGWGGVAYIAKLWTHSPQQMNDQDNWSSWEVPIGVMAGVSQGRLETQVPWQAFVLQEGTPVTVIFQVRGWDGQEQFSQDVMSNKPGLLRVSERSLAARVLSGSNVPLLGLEMAALEGDYSVGEIRIEIGGTTQLNDISVVRLLDSTMAVLDSRVVMSRTLILRPSQPIRIAEDDIVSLTVVADVTGSTAATLGARLASDRPVAAEDGSALPGAVTKLTLYSTYPLGYIGLVPPTVVIDGGFEDWTGVETDPSGEPETQGIQSLDIASFGADFNGSASFYLRLYGKALEGTATPQPSLPAPNGSIQPTADTDRDTVPDTVDPLPFDFNNDGMPDNATSHDFDADGVVDYPYGIDYWLNATIPGTFPPPYQGRFVSLYIGPSNRPMLIGEDFARFFLDVDNVTGTGYSVGGIGADYMVEVSGREGRILSNGLWRHSGTTSSQWAWTSTGTAISAIEQDRLEVSGTIPGANSSSRVFWETSDWREFAGDSAQSSTRGTRGINIDGVPMGLSESMNSYEDEAGRVQIADLTIVPTGGRYAYSAEKNGLAAYFTGTNDEGTQVLLQRGDLLFSWQPTELTTDIVGVLDATSIPAGVKAAAEGGRITYADIFPGVDDTFTIALNKVKHDLLFRSVAAVPTGGDTLVVRGKVLLSNGSVFVVDEEVQSRDFVASKGIQVISPSGIELTLTAPYAYERADIEARIDGAFRVERAGEAWFLSMEVPLKWFLDRDRSYPVVLDPTAIIDTSTSTSPTIYHHQRRIFYDGTYFWAFYFDGSNTMYEYSSDGMSWVNTKVQAFTNAAVQWTSVWYHDTGSTKIVYIAGDTTNSDRTVAVRRGTISGTTITWGAESEATISTNNEGSKAPFILRGSDGYLWVGALAKEGLPAYNFGVARSTNTDDVSAWNAYSTMLPSNIATAYIEGSLFPLSSGDIYCAWYADGTIAGKKYTAGSGWGSVESIDTAPGSIYYATPAGVVDGSGNIRLVYVSSSGNVLYRQRTSSWGSATTLDSASSNQYATISRETTSGDLYAFWKPSSGQITAKKYSGGSWTSVALQTNTLTKNWVTSIYDVSGSSKISWAWSEGAGSVKDVRFSMISTTVKSVTVDTSTSSSSTQYSHQRKVFYDGTYYWAFYDDGSNAYYTYSSDGETWTNGYTQLFTTSSTKSPSVWYYSGATKIVYAVGDDAGNDRTVVVKRGTISGSTITWGSDYTVTISGSNVVSKIPFVCRDSSGYVWIGSNTQETLNYNFAAARSTNTDDVSAWNAATVLMSAAIASNYIYGMVLPLGSGDVYALWYANGAIDGKKYTAGSGWGSVENINTTSTGVSTKGPSAVVDSSNYVNLVFSDSSGSIIYRQRTTSWGSATVVTTTTSNVYPSITLESGSGDLYVFWIDSTNQITAKKYSSGSWSSLSGIDASTTTKNYLTTIYSVSGVDKVSWLWGKGGISPYEVKFARIPEFEVALVLFVMIAFIPPLIGRRYRTSRGTNQEEGVPRQ